MTINLLPKFSNFKKSLIKMEGDFNEYPTVEHAFQAQKTLDLEQRKKIANTGSPVIAKYHGRHVTLRPNWDEIKNTVMAEALMYKFSNNKALAKELIETGDEELVEFNRWHDNYWGHCVCVRCKDKPKSNYLGILLQQVRSILRKQNEPI